MVATGEDGGQHPGAALGRPPAGPGSLAPAGRRLVAVAVDWLLSLLVADMLFGLDSAMGSFAPLLVFGVSTWVLVGTLGTTVGQRVMGMRVEAAGGGWAGPRRALVRTLLLLLVLPAVLTDPDGRPLHDRAAGTAIVRT